MITKNTITLFIILIIILYASIIYMNKKIIDNYSDKKNLLNDINNLRGLLWANYIFTTVISIYLMIKLYSKNGFYNNKFMFVITIFILLLNTGLSMHEETLLKTIDIYKTEHNLNNIYTITTIMSVVNIISLLALIYTNDKSQEERGSGFLNYEPKYSTMIRDKGPSTLQYTYTEDRGMILNALLNPKNVIKPTPNISYENIFQGDQKPVIQELPRDLPRDLPNVFKNVNKQKKVLKLKEPDSIEDIYINPLLLQDKQYKATTQIKPTEISKKQVNEITNKDVYVNPLLFENKSSIKKNFNM